MVNNFGAAFEPEPEPQNKSRKHLMNSMQNTGTELANNTEENKGHCGEKKGGKKEL